MLLGPIRAHVDEPKAVAGQALGQKGQVSLNHGRYLRIPTCRLMIDHHHDGLSVWRHLYGPCHDAVGDDSGPALRRRRCWTRLAAWP